LRDIIFSVSLGGFPALGRALRHHQNFLGPKKSKTASGFHRVGFFTQLEMEN
jgi:hypothetical protein